MLLVTLLAFCSSLVWAETAEDNSVRVRADDRFEALQRLSDRLSKFNKKCLNCSDVKVDEATQRPACFATWNRFYSKDDLDFTLAFGYMDFDGNGLVVDLPYRLAIEDKLQAPCEPGDHGACGFVSSIDLDGDDPDLFMKNIVGPDGRKKLIKIHLLNSSMGLSDSSNRSAGKPPECFAIKSASTSKHPKTKSSSCLGVGPVQALKSKQARAHYMEAVKKSDLAFYVGHGRYKTGASFETPVLTSSGVRDQSWYRAHREPWKEVLSALKAAKPPPKLMGIFACDASAPDSLGPSIRAAQPATGVVASSGIVSFETMANQAVSTLDSVLAQRCEPEFRASLAEAPDAAEAGEHAVKAEKPAVVEGFFEARSDDPWMKIEAEAPVLSPKNQSGSPLLAPIHPAGQVTRPPLPGRVDVPPSSNTNSEH